MKRISLLRSCFIIYSILIFTNCISAKIDDEKKEFLKNSHREDHFGIPFVYLQGTDYEVGYQYGFLLKDELKLLYADFEVLKKDLMDKEIKYLPWYQRVVANLFGSMVFRHKINNYADRLPSNIQDQLIGASESSGLPVSFFREIQVIVDLYSNRCEAIILKKGNHTYHCHNLDQPMPVSLISKYPVVVNYNITGKQKYTDFGFISLFMVTTGFNESGISISENGNNSPIHFDKENCSLYSDKSKLITETHNLNEVDSIVNTLKFPMGIIYTIASSSEKQAHVYDMIGLTKGKTIVNNYKFIANKTVSSELGKKSETIRAGNFHETAREIKFAELIDTTKSDVIDGLIHILSNSSFYHYTEPIPVYLESLHNYETDQSVIFDLADSTIYFTYNIHFAAWNRWLKYNYRTRKVSIYKEADPILNNLFTSKLNEVYRNYESCDWRDTSNVRSVLNIVIRSGINNYFSLNFLSTTYLNNYNSPFQAEKYADTMISKYPDIITGYYNKGLALEAENKYKDAIDEYLNALDCKINCEYYLAETYEHLALLNNILNKKESAANYAAKALTIHNQYWIPEYLNERINILEKISKNQQ